MTSHRSYFPLKNSLYQVTFQCFLKMDIFDPKKGHLMKNHSDENSLDENLFEVIWMGGRSMKVRFDGKSFCRKVEC